MLRMGDDFPDEIPAHWIVYFGVEDTDSAAEKAQEGGATMRAEPFDTEAGRIAVFTDPHGAAFALINQGGGDVAGEAGGEDEDESADEDHDPEGSGSANEAESGDEENDGDEGDDN